MSHTALRWTSTAGAASTKNKNKTKPTVAHPDTNSPHILWVHVAKALAFKWLIREELMIIPEHDKFSWLFKPFVNTQRPWPPLSWLIWEWS